MSVLRFTGMNSMMSSMSAMCMMCMFLCTQNLKPKLS